MVAPDLEPVVHHAGSWNLRVGRSPDRVAQEVATLLFTRDLDWLTVCEASGYTATLRARLIRAGYVVLTDERDGSAHDSAVIVRTTFGHGTPHLHRLGGVEWERKPGRPGLHWARSAISAEVSPANVLSTHLPPGPFGPRFPLRRKAYAKAARRVVQIVRQWDAPWLLPGDWNKPKAAEGSWFTPSPQWVASKLGAHITGDGIDYVLHKGCQVSDYRRIRFGGSDHEPVLFTVTY